MEKPRNYLIQDVTINYASRLHNSSAPFGREIFEGQIQVFDEKKAEELRENHVPVKDQEKDNSWVLSLKRNVYKANGEPNGKVRVVDNNKQPLDPSIIGNGSIANVIVYQYPYDTAGRKGIANSLTAIQVTKLVEYTGSGSIDFDVVGDVSPATSSTGVAKEEDLEALF